MHRGQETEGQPKSSHTAWIKGEKAKSTRICDTRVMQPFLLLPHSSYLQTSPFGGVERVVLPRL